MRWVLCFIALLGIFALPTDARAETVYAYCDCDPGNSQDSRVQNILRLHAPQMAAGDSVVIQSTQSEGEGAYYWVRWTWDESRNGFFASENGYALTTYNGNGGWGDPRPRPGGNTGGPPGGGGRGSSWQFSCFQGGTRISCAGT